MTIKHDRRGPVSLFLFIAFLTFGLSFAVTCSAAEKVVLTAVDGYRIAGNFTKANGKAGVVLLHMYRHDKESWEPLIAH